ncbi:MAG TPA: hypothetical protein VFJ24_07200 [Gaiellales bacterium]|nr:hypothetical protein [Gaiellales bacterium]
MALLSLLGVLLASALLGVEVWVVGIWLLARLVAVRELSPRTVLTVGAGFVLSALGYVVVVVLLALAVGT